MVYGYRAIQRGILRFSKFAFSLGYNLFTFAPRLLLQIIAQPYTFTAADRQRIEALGYRVAGIPFGL
jgi:hypothetical protein